MIKLLKLKSKGFRSLYNLEIDFESLTVLIGENDAGKSSVLDLLDIFINNKQLEEKDFYLDAQANREQSIEVIVELGVNNDDIEALSLAKDNRVIIQKKFFINRTVETYYLGTKPADEKIPPTLSTLNAAQQKDLIISLNPSVTQSEISNDEKRNAWYSCYLHGVEKVEDWILVNNDICKNFIRFERYSSMDYSNPGAIVYRTLKQVYEQTIYQNTPDGQRSLIEPLIQVEKHAGIRIQEKVKELERYIQKYSKRVKSIGYDSSFDFSNSFRQGELMLDRGLGSHALSRIGDGTKRRMFMAVTDWDREVTIAQTKTGANLPSSITIIRGYDEPDTNLHYEAQRLMYYSISDIVNTDNSRTQAIICTHSLTMIDRAPAQSIRLFRLNDIGHTQIEKLETDFDPDIEEFLKNVALELGITNTIMFYERCFILIEGDTEESALPILYKKLYRQSLLEDCIRIVNTKRNNAIKEFLKLFSKNRKDILIVFVDKDSENSREACLTRPLLKEAGFDDKFIDERFIFVGTKEYEDSFSNTSIVCALRSKWTRKDGLPWDEEEIEKLRSEKKFSDALKKYVRDVQSDTLSESNWTKPSFGKALADTIQKDEIPTEVTKLFTLARKIVGLDA
jgi:putative ATP-dependent endonuclease of the OLD family